MAGNNALCPISGPAKRPFVGNLMSINSESPVMDVWRIAQEPGGTYWLAMPGMPGMPGTGGQRGVDDRNALHPTARARRLGKSLALLRALDPVGSGLGLG